MTAELDFVNKGFYDKQMLVDAICGVVPDMRSAELLTKQGYMTFNGNQWNENWKWNDSFLAEKDHDHLKALYLRLRGSKSHG